MVDGPAEGDAGDVEIEVEQGEAELTPEARVAELEAQIAELEAAKKETYDRLLRATADHENFRKRTQRELADARVDEKGRVLREILPVIDNLERALEHAQGGQGSNASILEGIKLVMRQFEQSLERCGVKVIDAVGKPFDPSLHEAVSQAPSADQPPGTVIEALQRGYQIGERLLRPTLAVVSIAMPTETAGQGADETPGKIED